MGPLRMKIAEMNVARLLLASAMGAVLVYSLGGCSAMPDAANPVEWYKSTRDWVSDSKTPEQKALEAAAKQTPIPGGSGPFPNLSTVPPRPQLHGKPHGEAGDELRRDGADARESDAVMRERESAAHKATIRPSTAPPPATKAIKAVRKPIAVPRKLPKMTRPPPPPSVDEPVLPTEALEKKSSFIDRAIDTAKPTLDGNTI